jgi:hypothetical protein
MQTVRIAMKFLGKLISGVGIMIAGIFAVDNFIVERVQTRVAEPLKKEVLAYRSADFQHFDSKIDKIDKKIDNIRDILRNK